MLSIPSSMRITVHHVPTLCDIHIREYRNPERGGDDPR
jgi:hypothetical protein